MFENIKNEVESLFKNDTSARGNTGETFYDIPDTHSVPIVASHLGIPIRGIKVGKYPVYDQNPQVNKDNLARYKTSLKRVTERL